MSKNVVICCDGTANEFAKNNTNVVKLYSTLIQDSNQQVSYYHPGLGTMEPAGALTTFSRKMTKILGMAIGYGLNNDIRDAYVFLMRNFQAGDRLFLFGFSRGAYTVRGVAALLRMYGLIRPGNEPLVPYAIRMMLGIQRSAGDDAAQKTAVSFPDHGAHRDSCAAGAQFVASLFGLRAGLRGLAHGAASPDDGDCEDRNSSSRKWRSSVEQDD